MIDKNKIKLRSEKIEIRDKKLKYLKTGLFVCVLFLIVLYLLLSLVYSEGKFTINLDKNFSDRTGIIIYENSKEKIPKLILEAKQTGFMDNISMNWISKNINNESDGSHNGTNYIAYTFYVENRGSKAVDYWYMIPIYDIVKNVDDAVRIMVYRNDDKKVYAKIGKEGNPEKDTIPFYSNDIVALEQRKDLEPAQIDKYTIVVWLEGDDPDCIDSILGGQLKLKMEFNQEFYNLNSNIK